ncbi:MAG: LysR family transcriptional regulator [Proteobacteria bacterium]|nr:LysR family transcriptional regulator [Pseudomonadota bacterium]
MLNWDDLQAFLLIARHGSLSAAARAAGVRQSTMGRRLAAMEARIGQPLLLRTRDGFRPTAAGEAILGNAERIEEEALAAERRITGQDVRLEGTIRLTTVETLAAEVVVPILAAFQRAHPGIAVDLLPDTRSLSLTRREADVALRLVRPSAQDVAARKVGEMAVGLYAAPAYLDRYGMPDFAAGAAGHRLVLSPPELMGLPEMAWFARIAARAAPACQSPSRYLQRAAVEAGMGIGCFARYLGDGRAGLARLTAPEAPPRRELWLAVHQDMRHAPRIRALTDFLADGLRAQGDRLAGRLAPLNAATAP